MRIFLSERRKFSSASRLLDILKGDRKTLGQNEICCTLAYLEQNQTCWLSSVFTDESEIGLFVSFFVLLCICFKEWYLLAEFWFFWKCSIKVWRKLLIKPFHCTPKTTFHSSFLKIKLQRLLSEKRKQEVWFKIS